MQNALTREITALEPWVANAGGEWRPVVLEHTESIFARMPGLSPEEKSRLSRRLVDAPIPGTKTPASLAQVLCRVAIIRTLAQTAQPIQTYLTPWWSAAVRGLLGADEAPYIAPNF